jgi:hypothetical protein
MKFNSIFFLISTVFLLSCETSGPGFNASMSEISVSTRSSVDEAFTLLPIHVYAFFSDGACAAYQTIESADDSLRFSLPVGNYTFYALAGVTAENYKLPLAMNAKASSPVPLMESVAEHSEIAAGRADVKIGDGGDDRLVLTLTRVVAQIKASVSGLPENIAGVIMSFNPVETQLLLDGSFDNGQEEKESSLLLAKREDGKWHTTDSAFIFPSKAPVTVGIMLIDSNGEKHKYSYNSTLVVVANHKYEITATYKPGGLPELNGIVNGTDWSGETKYTFDFGGEDPVTGSEAQFAPGDIYQDVFYILDAEEITPGRIELTILNPKSPSGLNYQLLYSNLLNDYVNGIIGWKLITEKEARLIYDLCFTNMSAINKLLKKYEIAEFVSEEKLMFENEDGILQAVSLKSAKFNMGVPDGNKERCHFRGMKKVSVSILSH